MKKLGKYLGNIFAVYGILTPLIVVSLSYVILISIERNDGITSLIQNYKGWFFTLLILGILLFAFCLIMLFKHIKSENINVGDLLLFIAFVLSLLLLVLFIFNPGIITSWLSILKWTVAGCGVVGTVLLGFIRSKYAKNTEK